MIRTITHIMLSGRITEPSFSTSHPVSAQKGPACWQICPYWEMLFGALALGGVFSSLHHSHHLKLRWSRSVSGPRKPTRWFLLSSLAELLPGPHPAAAQPLVLGHWGAQQSPQILFIVPCYRQNIKESVKRGRKILVLPWLLVCESWKPAGV